MSNSVKQEVQKQVIRQVKQVKHTSPFKEMFSDFGNLPLIIANSAGLVMIMVVSTRKLFFHPDVSISDANRNSPLVQNETPERYDSGSQFREQTKAFANFLTPLSNAVMQTAVGTDQLYDKWHLDFVKTAPIVRPLEETNYFEDNLYSRETPDEYALPIDNTTLHKNYEVGGPANMNL